MTVAIDGPERMNLLGLIMKGLLDQTLAIPANERRAGRLEGDVAVRAGRMGVTLRFADGKVTVVKGDEGPAKARVAGTMEALLGMVSGSGVVAPVLSGRVRIGGNPFFLLKMLPLIKVPGANAR